MTNNPIDEILSENLRLKKELERHNKWYDTISDDIPGDLAGNHYGVIEWYSKIKLERNNFKAQNDTYKALFEICANAIVQHYQALEDDLPAKAESFLQELLKALYIYCPKESADGTFSELAREMRLHIFTFKD